MDVLGWGSISDRINRIDRIWMILTQSRRDAKELQVELRWLAKWLRGKTPAFGRGGLEDAYSK